MHHNDKLLNISLGATQLTAPMHFGEFNAPTLHFSFVCVVIGVFFYNPPVMGHPIKQTNMVNYYVFCSLSCSTQHHCIVFI
jgi:hypothetical protein